MRIKKYISPSLKEGKAVILRELGEDAIILSSRTVKNPDGLSDSVEIVAALDDQPVKVPSGRKILLQPDSQIETVNTQFNDYSSYMNAISQIYRELGLLRDMVAELGDNVRYKYSGALGLMFGKLFKILRKADFTEDQALMITGKLTARGITRFEEAVREARILIGENLILSAPLISSGKGRIAAFVGPTGSGKTSSLVKIAVVAKLISKANILIVTTDTYKVGGADQLGTYASIAAIPFLAAYSPEELSDIISRETARDYIFIDTVGKSQEDKSFLNEIRGYLEAARPNRLYLVESATSSRSSFLRVLENFAPLKPDALILTKTDEAPTLGNIYCGLQKNNMPIEYISTGQKVPEDIEPADRSKLSELILSDTIINENNR